MSVFMLCGRRVALAGAICGALGAASAGVAKERLVYSFKGGTDGGYPSSGLINVGGTLYGTTSGATNAGNVFAVTPAGAETVLYTFSGGSDGGQPSGGVINVGGIFYGTTQSGGVGGFSCADSYCGTVYSVTPAGVETVIYNFQGGTDGYYPTAGLLNVGGTLYGTTNAGGASNAGTVFSVTPAGTESVLHTFSGSPDGSGPNSALVQYHGVFYGTTTGGGHGYGTVFSVTADGTESVVYAFKGGADGANPNGLVLNGVVFFGTTEEGGAANAGTIFSLGEHGGHTVVYSFEGYPDGAYPMSGLINFRGTVIGTTSGGGTYGYPGYGTVFSLMGGTERVLHTFLGGIRDGVQPQAGVVARNARLYGTTHEGGGTGCYGSGCGTVFSMKY